MSFVLVLLLQLGLQLPNPDANVNVGGEIEGPYIDIDVLGQTTKVILKNGLTVIVRESNAVGLTSIITHVKVGYFDEPDRLSGISHVIEHMFFKGTPERGVGEIARQTKALGGSLDAYTYYDRTVFQAVVPSDNAVAALEIQADALWNPVFDPVELVSEIEVVLPETVAIRYARGPPGADTRRGRRVLRSVLSAFERHPGSRRSVRARRDA